eukprot:SAG31_NODE_6108_length_2169_cov_1.860386_3_plen_57_part_00
MMRSALFAALSAAVELCLPATAMPVAAHPSPIDRAAARLIAHNHTRAAMLGIVNGR